MNDLLPALIADLRRFSAQLLDRGLAPAGPAPRHASGAGATTHSRLLHQVEILCNLMPQLIDELDTQASVADHEWLPSLTPARALAPPRPDAYARVGDRLLPRYFLRAEPRRQPDVRPLGFVLHVMEHLTSEFTAMHGRLDVHIAEARQTRQGTSQYAMDELQQLDGLALRMEAASFGLRQVGALLHRTVGSRCRASDRLPHPFPSSPAWRSFRRLAEAVLHPELFLTRHLDHLVPEDASIADLPFLYQRWVGVQLLHSLTDDFGFTIQNDPVGALFLGGRVSLQRGPTTVVLWCEPRLERAAHPSDLTTIGTEATPDYVLVTPGRGGPDAFVLDATLTQDATLLERKTHYRERLCFAPFRLMAGVPGRQRPLRAWAAAPVAGTSLNRLTLPDGSCGIVPMHPSRGDSEPLRAWLGDIVDHADAWQFLADARDSRIRPTSPPTTDPAPPPSGQAP